MHNLAPGRLEASVLLESAALSTYRPSEAVSHRLLPQSPRFQYTNPHRNNFMGDSSQYISFMADSTSSLAVPELRNLNTFEGHLSNNSTSIYGNTFSSAIRSDLHVDVPSILRSVLRDEDIDFKNDFYWLMKVSHLYSSVKKVFSLFY